MTTALFTSNPTYTVGNFRIWAKKTHDAILSTGITDASSSNSITFGSSSSDSFDLLPAPTAYNYPGHQVYKFADALQATHPVFIKIGYGAGTNAAYPAIHVTVGNTHDGSGSVTGPPVTDTDVMLASAAQTDEVSQYMICGDTNRIIVTGPAWSIETQSLPDEMYFLSVERTKDVNGDDTDEGIIVAMCHQAATFYWYTMPFIGLTPTRDTKWPAAVGTNFPASTGGRQIVCPVFPIAGVAPYPGKNVLVTQDENFTDMDVIPIAIYTDDDVVNYFKHAVGGGTQGFSAPAGITTAVVLQRWD